MVFKSVARTRHIGGLNCGNAARARSSLPIGPHMAHEHLIRRRVLRRHGRSRRALSPIARWATAESESVTVPRCSWVLMSAADVKQSTRLPLTPLIHLLPPLEDRDEGSQRPQLLVRARDGLLK